MQESTTSSATTSAGAGQLRPTIGLTSAIVLVISAVIGTGVFKKVVPMAAELQSPGLVLAAWLLAGLISLAGTLSNAEVASLLAGSGGEYAYFRTIYGRFFAFLFGWANFAVIRTSALASIAYVFAQSLNRLLPLPATPAGWAELNVVGLRPLDNFGVKIVAIGLVWALTFANVRGVAIGERISRILTVVMVLTMGFIVVSGLLSPVGDVANWQVSAQPPAGVDLGGALALACLGAFWAYEGWSNLGYIGGEVHNPQRNLPRALLIGSLSVMGLYLLMNAVYLYILPINELIALNSQPNSIAAVNVVERYLGGVGGLLVSVLILVTTFNCTSSTALMASRLFYAMAKDGLFFRAVNYVHPVYRTPSRSLYIQAAWTTLLILSGSFDQLTDMLIFASFIFYGATAVGVFVLRRRWPDRPRPYRVVGYPVVPAIFILFCAYLIVSTWLNRTAEAAIGTALMLTGLPFYWRWRNRASEEEKGR